MARYASLLWRHMEFKRIKSCNEVVHQILRGHVRNVADVTLTIDNAAT